MSVGGVVDELLYGVEVDDEGVRARRGRLDGVE